MTDALEQVARASYARLLAILAARLRDLAAAEDALADAFRAALETWPQRGVPDRPEAWLMRAALRQGGHARARDATRAAALPVLTLLAQEAEEAMPHSFPDHRLGLLFACTHPAIDAGVQVPLMLQAVLGLSAERIAPAFLMSPAALGQRLSRAKAGLRRANASFALPDPSEVAVHLPAVMEAILAAAALGWEGVPGSDPARLDLGQEAVWLAEALVLLMPDEPEPLGLMALILHVTARAPARRGIYIPLSDQNVALWSSEMIQRADAALMRASVIGRLGRFQVEAAIQSVHAERARTGRTNWAALEVLHAALMRLHPTTGGAVAAAAVAMERHGPRDALDRLSLIDAPQFQPLHALRAEAHLRAGDVAEGRAALTLAIGLAEDPALRAWLTTRLARI